MSYLLKSLMAWGEKSVSHSAGVSPGGPVSSTRGQEGEQAVVGGVCGVLNDSQGLPEAPPTAPAGWAARTR